MYIGAFGGALHSDSPQLTQTGTIFFPEAINGPLAVDARGHSNKSSTGFGGVQIGYEGPKWPISIPCVTKPSGCSKWSITPAAELEAYFFKHTRNGALANPNARLIEQEFVDSFPMNVNVYLANGVFALDYCKLRNFTPYIGCGVGVARIFIKNAQSLQVDPLEPGINHFNSDPTDSAWAFAAQFKTGLRFNFWERFHLFGEYRLSYVDTSRYIFGSTIDPTHAPTTTWIVDVKGAYYNAFAFGIQCDINR